MRPMLAATVIALAAALSSPGFAQDYSLPDTEPKATQGGIPDQRLEVANKEMAYAAERLEEAAVQGDEPVLAEAFQQSRETVEEVRDLIQDLPPDQRTPYEEAILQVEQALAKDDARAAAAAMRDLRQRVLELATAR